MASNIEKLNKKAMEDASSPKGENLQEGEFVLSSSRTVTLTPDFIEWYRSLPLVSEERSVQAKKVEYLIGQIENTCSGSLLGPRFLASEAKLAVVRFGGDLYRANFQHCTEALTQYGKPFSLPGARINYYYTSSKEGLANARTNMDLGRSQSRGNMEAVQMATIEELDGMPKFVRNALPKAVGILCENYDRHIAVDPRTIHETVDVLRDDYAVESKKLAKILPRKKSDAEHVFKAGVLAFLLKLVKVKGEAEAKRFLMGVAYVRPGEQEDLRDSLRAFLVSAYTGKAKKQALKPASQTDIFACCQWVYKEWSLKSDRVRFRRAFMKKKDFMYPEMLSVPI